MLDEFKVVLEIYAQNFILYLESMSQEEWRTLGIVLLTSFVIIFILGITNRVVIFYNGADLFWTASIFIIPILIMTYSCSGIPYNTPFINSTETTKLDFDMTKEEVREYAIKHREEILEYAETFDWINVVKDHYIPNVEKVLAE